MNENNLYGDIETLKIRKKDIYDLYPQIGFGDEGSVHKYNDLIALKIFMFIRKELLSKKHKKIEALSKFSDESFCFPKGFVCFENEQKEGYFTDLVIIDEKLKDFDGLLYLKNTKCLIEYLVKADAAIERVHQKGFIIGDVKRDNIMIDINGNPRFVDVDNYAFADFNFDLLPGRTMHFERIFCKSCSPVDNDRFLYAMMCLQFFAYGTLLQHASSPSYFNTLIELLNLERESKEILRAIFSDAKDKPYMSCVLKKINPDIPLLNSQDIQILNSCR